MLANSYAVLVHTFYHEIDAIGKALLAVRFHDLRHGAATVLLAAKVDLKVVSELLGHSSIAITADIYAHVLPEMQQEIVNKMDDLFKPPIP
jgi:integrase